MTNYRAEQTTIRAAAEQRLADLGLSSDLIDDASGQTSEDEHLSWLATAPADEITRWADDMARDAE